MKKTILKKEQRERRRKRIRSRIFGTPVKPRISVFKSNKNIQVQLVDDLNSKTIFGSDTRKMSGKNLVEKSFSLGKVLAEKAKEMKISKAVFDRGGFMYTGSIKALSMGAREGGLQF